MWHKQGTVSYCDSAGAAPDRGGSHHLCGSESIGERAVTGRTEEAADARAGGAQLDCQKGARVPGVASRELQREAVGQARGRVAQLRLRAPQQERLVPRVVGRSAGRGLRPAGNDDAGAGAARRGKDSGAANGTTTTMREYGD